jgi:outer membrane protein TolC
MKLKNAFIMLKNKTMFKRLFLIILSFLFAASSMAQEHFTIRQLIDSAEINYPSARQKEYLKALEKESQHELNNSLLPLLNVSGQATLQSEVTEFELPGATGFPQQPKKNYNIGLDLRFPITDFDIVRSRKELEEARTNVSINQLDIELQRVRERVANLYGNVLLQKENQKILEIRIRELQSQKNIVAVGVSSGMVLKSNQLVFESEILTTEQRINDIVATLEGLTEQLSLLTGHKVAPTDIFVIPDIDTLKNINNRPELAGFEAQKKVLTLEQTILEKENRPRLSIFGQGFYGRPGYNFLDIDPRLYGLTGISLSWNINNVINQRSKQRSTEINKLIIDQRKTTFNLELQSQLAQTNSEIVKYNGIIKKDVEIVSKRKEILRSYASQLQNGAITSTEYLTELNAENTAELNLVLHSIQQAIAKEQYNILMGDHDQQ